MNKLNRKFSHKGTEIFKARRLRIKGENYYNLFFLCAFVPSASLCEKTKIIFKEKIWQKKQYRRKQAA
jgi:hypothetical protein